MRILCVKHTMSLALCIVQVIIAIVQVVLAYSLYKERKK